ncbi:MAG: hypothetical protein K6U74_14395 [Firmicutes bacterium]|nr:hypothetical protein [Bacillota bacterium]
MTVGAVAVLVVYLAVHTYQDHKSRKTSNKVNLLALVALACLAYPDIAKIATGLLFCLVVGLFFERLGVWLPGDTRMFAICGGYVSLFGAPVSVYVITTMLFYVIFSAFILAGKKMFYRPSLLALFQPAMRKGVWFPGAALISVSSLGVIAWTLWNSSVQ